MPHICQVHEESFIRLKMIPLEASCLAFLATAPSSMWPWQEVKRLAHWEAGALSMLWTLGGWANHSRSVMIQERWGPKSRILLGSCHPLCLRGIGTF